MNSISRSLIYSFADSYLSTALQLASTMVIARLLSPTEIGVFAVAAVFTAFASTFRDFGVAEYLIQERELNNDKIRAALTVNIGVSWTMSMVLFVIAVPVAEFYREPGIADVMRVLAINFLLIPFGAVTMAKFRRDLNFRPIFIANLLSNVTAFVVSIMLAWKGFGYMSLAWSSLAGIVMTIAVSLYFRPSDFPRWPGLREIDGVLHFGKYASGIYLFGQIGKSAPEMIIGRALDLASVAYFSRASGLTEIFYKTVLRGILPVCLPYFANNQREEGQIAPGYLRAMSYLTAVGWTFFAFLGIVAFGAVHIIYGDQWTSAVPLAQVLCAVAIVELTHYLAKEVLIASGNVQPSNSLQMGVQGLRLVILLVTVPFGIMAGCWGLLGAATLGALFAQWILGQKIGLRILDVARICLPSVWITLLAVAPVAAWAWEAGVNANNYVQVAFWGGLLTLASWLLAVKLFLPPLWQDIKGLLNRAR